MLCLTYITDKTVLQNAAEEPERNDEHEKRLLEMQTFLLAYLTAKVAIIFGIFLNQTCFIGISHLKVNLFSLFNYSDGSVNSDGE